jgi:FtsZ-binding cell division protein ZapB
MSVSTSELSDWNISIFSQPRHPSFNDKKVVEQIDNVKLLKLEFDSLEDRQEFTAKFNLALRKRDEAERNYQKIHRTIQWEGEKLGQSSKPGKLSKSISRSSTMTSLEPLFLQPLSRFSSLTISEDADQIFEMASPAPPPSQFSA